jgi:hypothetical protein
MLWRDVAQVQNQDTKSPSLQQQVSRTKSLVQTGPRRSFAMARLASPSSHKPMLVLLQSSHADTRSVTLRLPITAYLLFSLHRAERLPGAVNRATIEWTIRSPGRSDRAIAGPRAIWAAQQCPYRPIEASLFIPRMLTSPGMRAAFAYMSRGTRTPGLPNLGYPRLHTATNPEQLVQPHAICRC